MTWDRMHILLLYGVVGGYSAIWLNHPADPTPGDFAVKYLSLPIFGIFLVLVLKDMAEVENKFTDYFIGCLAAVVLALMVALASTGYVAFFNALWGRQEAVTVEGVIREARVFRVGSRHTTYACRLQIEQSGGEMLTLRKGYSSVKENVCGKYKEGDKFFADMTKGSLGILYTKNNW
jgi:hypothetical protein